MPRVPTYDNFQADPTVLPNARMQAPSGPAPGTLAAQQGAQLGNTLGQSGDATSRITMDITAQANEAKAREIDTDMAAKLDALQFDKDTGFMGLQGDAPMKQMGDYAQAAKQIAMEAQSAAPNPQVRDQIDRASSARLMALDGRMAAHANEQFQKWRVQTSVDRAQVSLQAGANDFRDPFIFDKNLRTALGEAENQGQMLGWDGSTTKLQAQKYTDEAYRMRYDAWRDADPVGALSSFQKNADKISPLARVQMYHQLFEAAALPLAQQLNASGGPGVVPATTSASDSNEPRGVRNNNPGNIIKGASPWQGEVNGSDPKYAAFDSPEAGIRAMGKTLLTYQDVHGLNTVQGLVSRWAPASEAGNNPVSYAQTVADAMGVKPDQPLDLHDADTLAALTKGMIKVENGKQPYSDQQIALGLSMANGNAQAGPAGLPPPPVTPGAADAWRNPNLPTGNPVIDALPADFKLHVLHTARSQAMQDMAEARDALRAKMQDAAAAYMLNGTAPNPPALAEFVQAYGQLEGPAQYASFQNVARLGQQLQQVKTLPNAALADLARTAKPAPEVPGFADAQRNYETLTQAIDKTIQMRQSDPIGYAQLAGSYGVQPIQKFDNLGALGQALSARAGVATRLSADYGTAPAVLSKDEAQGLGAAIKAAPVEAQKQYLGVIAHNLGDMSLIKSTMQALAPDQPVMALAGIYQARGARTTENRDVADLLLRGQAILTPNTKTDGTGHDGGRSLLKMPEDKLLLSEFNAATGDAFSGREQARDLFVQAARAIYAAKSAESGDYSGNLDANRWRAAINMATGGVQDHNGSKIVMPYGMPYDSFVNTLQAQVKALAPKVLAAQPAEMMRLPLSNIGDGRYLFRRGAGYLVDKDGRPVVVDMTGGQQ